jgi:hypothetical protein
MRGQKGKNYISGSQKENSTMYWGDFKEGKSLLFSGYLRINGQKIYVIPLRISPMVMPD